MTKPHAHAESVESLSVCLWPACLALEADDLGQNSGFRLLGRLRILGAGDKVQRICFKPVTAGQEKIGVTSCMSLAMRALLRSHALTLNKLACFKAERFP